jgi:hypothetical protein
MSLYNMLFGKNPMAATALAVLGVDSPAKIPRFRDAYFTEKDGIPIIVIHTRTGGGNRDFYENERTCKTNYPDYFTDSDEPPSGPWNDDLRALPGFICDMDSEFDSTYADFFFNVPEKHRADVEQLLSKVGTPSTPAEKWKALFDAMKTGKV